MNLADGRVCSSWHRAYETFDSEYVLNDPHLFPDGSVEIAGSRCR